MQLYKKTVHLICPPLGPTSTIDQLCREASGEITELKILSSESEIVFFLDKHAANKIVKNAKNSASGISVSVKSPIFIGVLKGTLTNYNKDHVEFLVPNCVNMS